MTPKREAIDRHPHLAETQPPGWVRVDLHSHTMWSGDSTTTPDELVEAVEASGLDVVAITDHNATKGAEDLAGQLPCRVIIGEEVKTHVGEIIGLFLQERIPFGLPPVEVAERIRAQGSVVYIPHPFDPLRNNLAEAALEELCDRGLVDALEGINGKTSLDSLNRRAVEFATGRGLAVGAGSDAHVPDALGAAYVEMPDFPDDDPEAFLASLRRGRIVGHHFDAPRRWRPRIVPSTSTG
ncbi:MAG: CehA/McbA family metallohydrolase [Acidimicrobiia bacterium]|nr:CehA/McbA family metallohydrolase [Acidimicrobiia bacterium]